MADTNLSSFIWSIAELSNATAGEHFPPRIVSPRMVNSLFTEDDEAITKLGIVRSTYDPAAVNGKIEVRSWARKASA